MGLFGVSPFFYENLNYAGGGNGHQHSQYTAEVTEDRDGNQHKDRVEAYGVADHLGVNIVAVQLLDHKESDDSYETTQ